MVSRRFYSLLLLASFLLLVSCGGKKEGMKGKIASPAGKSTVKIGNFEWFFNNQGLNKAIENAKNTDKLIFAVFSSMW